ncbi:LemA family protein [Simplicispira lacusdiani]|uniref:LemA family protein n=1 Tax=Simplicispira lacusdiani TaxID=2213010 RepID=UPI000E76A387|nr:LemA family protein [Simplicispira lacusdiani]
MFASPFFWIVVAVALFWAVGAYNRLVRLRSAAIQAFSALDAHLVRLLALLGECEASLAVVPGEPVQARTALQAATMQMGVSLAVARTQPLQAEAAAALSTARHALEAAWQGAAAQQAATEGGLQRPRWLEHLEQHQAPSAQALERFNLAVQQYNEAIDQFPAKWLAWLYGFQPGRTL